MNVTSTVDVKNASFKGVAVHVKHDKNQEHSNKDIDFDLTQLNIGKTLINEKSIQEIERNLFEKEFLNFNQKQKASGHKARMKSNVHQYVLDKSQSFDKTIVATFANKQIQDELLNGKTDDEKQRILKLESQALADYAQKFNERNSNMKITKFVTNVDESTPHVHAQLIGAGDTSKKGKVSISFSNMIKRAYREQNNGHKINDSREALSWWRKQEDQALVDSFNQYLTPELGIDFNLYRTGEHIADFDSYKRIREVNEKDKALEYAEEIKYYDPNHIIDKDLYNPIIEKDDIKIEQENYQNEYQSLSFSVVDLDPKNNIVIKSNVERRQKSRNKLEQLAKQENEIPSFGKYRNKVSDMTSETNYEKIPYIILDTGKVHFKDQIKTNDDNKPVFKEEKKEPISTEIGFEQHLRMGFEYLREVARKLREKFQKRLRDLKQNLEQKENELNERAEMLDKREVSITTREKQVTEDQKTLKNASMHELNKIIQRNSRDFGPSR